MIEGGQEVEIAYILLELGKVNCLIVNTKEAVNLMERTYTIRKQWLGESDPLTIEACVLYVELLIQLTMKQGIYQELIEYLIQKEVSKLQLQNNN